MFRFLRICIENFLKSANMSKIYFCQMFNMDKKMQYFMLMSDSFKLL
jgi:hypothetical protein